MPKARRGEAAEVYAATVSVSRGTSDPAPTGPQTTVPSAGGSGERSSNRFGDPGRRRPRIGRGGHRPTDHEPARAFARSEEHTSELQSLRHLVCRLLLEKKKPQYRDDNATNNKSENAEP